MEIHVIRHTRVKSGLTVCYGQSNVPLADTFEQEAAQIKKVLRFPFDAVFCSPSERCIKLSKALNLDEIIIESALKEMCFGVWENQKWDEIDRDQLEKWCESFVTERPPKGESLQDVFDRVVYFLETLQNRKYQKILLITHAGVIRCIHAHINNVLLKNLFNIPVGFGELFMFNLQ